MRTSPTVLTLTAAALLALLGACASSEPVDDTTGGAGGGGAGDTGMTASGDTAAGGGGMAQAGDRGQARQDKVRVLVDQFLASARGEMEKGGYEAAWEALSHAYELDPSNTEVVDLMDQVSRSLGERSGTIGEITRTAEDMGRVRRTEARLAVDNKIISADRNRDAGDLAAAIRDLEDAILILRWNPYLSGGTDTGITEDGLRDRLASLRAEKAEMDRERKAQSERIALAEQAEREREERDRNENLIKTFLRKANDSFYRERYKEAVTYCEQALEIDPNRQEAVELRDVAREAGHSALERRYSDDFRYHWREIFDDLEYDDLPSDSMIEFPDNRDWERINARGPLQFKAESEEMTPEDQRVWSILRNQTVNVSFTDVPFEDVVDWFRVQTGANFIISPLVLDEAEEVSLTLPAMPAEQALTHLVNFSPADIDFSVRDGVVYIETLEEAVGGQVLEFYDVRDITRTVASFPSRDFNLKPSNTFDDEELEEIEPAPIVINADALPDLILANIAVDSWDLDPNNTINYISGALVVRQRPEVHRQINALLNDLRKNAGTLINVETRFLELEDRFLQDIGVDFRGLDGQNGSTATAPVPNVQLDDFGVAGAGGVGSPGTPFGVGSGTDAGAYFTQGGKIDLRGRLENLYDLALGDRDFRGTGGFALEFTYLDDTQLEAILRAVEKSEMAEVVKAQNLTVFNGQRANIVNQDHITYLRDFEVEIAQGAVIADPVLDIITNGTMLDVRPVVSADRRFITMEVRPSLATLIEPMRTFRTSLAIGNQVEIMLPEMQIQRVRTTVTMPDGATLMLGGMKSIVETRLDSGMPFLKDIPVVSFFFSSQGTERSRQRILILVRAKIVIPEEGEPVISP